MDANKEQKVIDIINSWVNNGYMFTAFDVTKAARAIGEIVRHNDIKEIIVRMFNNSELGIYTRDLVDVGAPIQPWVYYHPYSDIANYCSHWLENNPTQIGMNTNSSTTGTSYTNNYIPIPAPAPAPAPALSNTTQTTQPQATQPIVNKKALKNQNILFATKEGRINVPIKLVRLAGYGPVDSVNVFLSNAKGSTFNSIRYVEADGRIRINKLTLDKLSSNTGYRVDVVSDKIFVSPA